MEDEAALRDLVDEVVEGIGGKPGDKGPGGCEEQRVEGCFGGPVRVWSGMLVR